MTPPNEHQCGEHSANCAKIDRAERDIQSLWLAIDNMRNWVIAGMAAVLLQVGMKVFDMVVK